MLADSVLALLSDGEFHSGQDLAKLQGVSRTAIWKQIEALTEHGVDIERVRGKGYRIEGGLELLDTDAIRCALTEAATQTLSDLGVLRVVDSTNAELKRGELGCSGATVCLAEAQTAGRGRRGRPWQSPFASNIYCSTAWRFAGGATAFEGLSLAVGVAVCRALETFGVEGLSLKWPNDVLRNGRKLSGILVEMNGDITGPCTAIVGIGINVAMPKSASAEIDQPWADLRAGDGTYPSRNSVVAQLLNELLPLLQHYESVGFRAWRSDWQALDAYADTPVMIHGAGEPLSGLAQGVDEQGALCLQTSGGMHRVHGGEVSLRPAS